MPDKLSLFEAKIVELVSEGGVEIFRGVGGVLKDETVADWSVFKMLPLSKVIVFGTAFMHNN